MFTHQINCFRLTRSLCGRKFENFETFSEIQFSDRRGFFVDSQIIFHLPTLLQIEKCPLANFLKLIFGELFCGTSCEICEKFQKLQVENSFVHRLARRKLLNLSPNFLGDTKIKSRNYKPFILGRNISFGFHLDSSSSKVAMCCVEKFRLFPKVSPTNFFCGQSTIYFSLANLKVIEDEKRILQK